MAFHYRTICCSRECAQVYLSRVLEARQKAKMIEISDENIASDTPEITKSSHVDHESSIDFVTVVEEKPKRKYTKKKPIESENGEQIDEGVGTSN